MKKSISLIITYLFLLNTFAQQAKTITRLNGKNISTTILQQRLEFIIDSAHIVGLQVAIINHNQTVWSHSFGLKDTEKHLKLDASTEMYAASFTKSISAYLFLRLVDNGIFSLDKPIQQYLKKPISEYPKWKELGDDTASFNKITARMLLCHSAGLPVLRAMYNDKVNLISKPGEKFYYSNEGMNLLGVVIEEYIGKPLEVLAKEEIFTPLHMHHTSMIWDSTFKNNFSFAYFKNGSNYGSERRSSGRAAGSATTIADDYAKFVINLMQRKGLSKQSYDQLFTPQITVKSKRGFGPLKDTLGNYNDDIKLSWGLGVGLFKSNYGNAFFHAGHGQANQNYYVAYPEKGIAIVLMSNSENFEAASQLIQDACIGSDRSPLKWLGDFDN